MIDSASRTVVRQIPPSGTVAVVVSGASAPRDDEEGIPCVCYGRPTRVVGIPTSDEGPVIVAAQVASAMAELGLLYPGGVYTPQQLVFDDARRPIGSPGLIHWPHLS